MHVISQATTPFNLGKMHALMVTFANKLLLSYCN